MIEMQNVSKIFKNAKQNTVAVQEVSFKIKRAEVLGLVGESGSGKSTLGRMLVRLEQPTSGAIFFEQKPLIDAPKKEIQMIFQDASSALNPRMTIETILQEPTQIHRLDDRVDELLDLVGLPKNAKHRFPHEFSGGQKQRINIARALALRPKFIVCDEPTSSLDASTRAQIVQLLKQLQTELQLTYLFISHDLNIIEQIATNVAVMERGRIIEIAGVNELFTSPQHSATKRLIDHALFEHKL